MALNALAIWLWTSRSFLDQGPIMKRTLPFRSSGLGPGLAVAAALAGALVAGTGDGVAALPQAATIAPTALGARPSARSRVTNVRRDSRPAMYESPSSVVLCSRSVCM